MKYLPLVWKELEREYLSFHKGKEGRKDNWGPREKEGGGRQQPGSQQEGERLQSSHHDVKFPSVLKPLCLLRVLHPLLANGVTTNRLSKQQE